MGCELRLAEHYLVMRRQRVDRDSRCREVSARPFLGGLCRWGSVPPLEMEDEIKAHFKKLKA